MNELKTKIDHIKEIIEDYFGSQIDYTIEKEEAFAEYMEADYEEDFICDVITYWKEMVEEI